MTEDLDIFERLSFYLKGDEMAVAFAVDLIWLSHLIDDLVDRDVERSVEDVKLSFRKLLVDFPHNPFFKRWQVQLEPLISNAYLAWLSSTYLEKGDREERFSAFYIRNETLMVIFHCLLLCGGPEWVQANGSDFWRDFGVKEYRYEEFLREATCHENVS